MGRILKKIPMLRARDLVVVTHFLCHHCRHHNPLPEEYVRRRPHYLLPEEHVRWRPHSSPPEKYVRRRPQSRRLSSLWSQLPRELVERVLLFLPGTEQARLRLVCKEWSTLLASSKFHEDSARTAFASRRPGAAWIMTMHHPQAGPKVKLKLERPHNLRTDLNFIPPRFGYHAESYASRAFMQMHGDDGLVCFGDTKELNTLSLGVLDMANKTWIELPELSPFHCRRRTYWVRVVSTAGFEKGEFDVWVYFSEADESSCSFMSFSSESAVWSRCVLREDFMKGNSWVKGIGFGMWKSSSCIYLLGEELISGEVSLRTFSANDGRLLCRFSPVDRDSCLGVLLEHSGKLLWLTWTDRETDKSTLTIWAMSMGSHTHEVDKASAVMLAQLLPRNVDQNTVKVTGLPRLSGGTIFVPLTCTSQGVFQRGPGSSEAVGYRQRTVGMAAYHILDGYWEHFPCGAFKNEDHVIARDVPLGTEWFW